MYEGKTESLLRKLSSRMDEAIPRHLSDKIKQQIPERLHPSRWGRDKISIIIHFKISRLTAVAVIILTLILCARFFTDSERVDTKLYQDLGTLLRLLPTSGNDPFDLKDDLLRFRDQLEAKGAHVEYYADRVSSDNPDAILMFWKFSDDSYRVILGDGRIVEATPEELIALHARMIYNKQ
jgi:hypothetical protein